MLLKITPKTNLFLQKLLGADVPQEKIDNYKSMYGVRTSALLNIWSYRECRIFNDDEIGVIPLDRDYLRAL